MTKTILIPENSIIEMLKALPEDALMDMFSKLLVACQRADISRDFLLTSSLTHSILTSSELVNMSGFKIQASFH